MRDYTELLSQYEHSDKDYLDIKNSLDTAFEDGLRKVAVNAIKKGFDDKTI